MSKWTDKEYLKQYKREYRKNNKESISKKDKEYYQANKSNVLKRIKNTNLETKAKAMRMYGGECLGCGSQELAILTIDHINRDGGKERKARGAGSSGYHFYHSLLKLQKRSDLRVLCFNCQLRARTYGSDIQAWPAIRPTVSSIRENG